MSRRTQKRNTTCYKIQCLAFHSDAKRRPQLIRELHETKNCMHWPAKLCWRMQGRSLPRKLQPFASRVAQACRPPSRLSPVLKVAQARCLACCTPLLSEWHQHVDGPPSSLQCLHCNSSPLLGTAEILHAHVVCQPSAAACVDCVRGQQCFACKQCVMPAAQLQNFTPARHTQCLQRGPALLSDVQGMLWQGRAHLFLWHSTALECGLPAAEHHTNLTATTD